MMLISIGMVVKVERSFEGNQRLDWIPLMNQTIGKEGTVVQVTAANQYTQARISVTFRDFGRQFTYFADCLSIPECPEDFAVYTTSNREYVYEDAGPDHILTSLDKINFGCGDRDVIELCSGHCGEAVKDVVCKKVLKASGTAVTHTKKFLHHMSHGSNWRLFTPRGVFPGGTEIITDEGIAFFADVDGMPVPEYKEGDERPLYRRPVPECGLYRLWKPEAGDIRPEGLQYRRVGTGNEWQDSGVVGKPVEEADLPKYEYRVPKEVP